MRQKDDTQINPAVGIKIMRNGKIGTITRVGIRPNNVRFTDVLWDDGNVSWLTDYQLTHDCQLVETE